MADLSREELIAYFNEHILYELLMLRYSKKRLNSETQILWNAMFAAFNVSARNLYDFLNNNGGNNEVNVHQFRHYAKGFRLGSISKITGTLQRINAQVFHMGMKRSEDADGKVKLDRVEEVFKWVESNMGELVRSFEDDFRAELDLEKADPSHAPTEYSGGPTGPGGPRPQSTNHVVDTNSLMQANQTHTTYVGGHPGWPLEKKD